MLRGEITQILEIEINRISNETHHLISDLANGYTTGEIQLHRGVRPQVPAATELRTIPELGMANPDRIGDWGFVLFDESSGEKICNLA